MNNDAISKGHVSDGLSLEFGNRTGSDLGRNMRRESGTELQTDQRESADNQRRILDENADNGGLTSKVQKSRSITAEQDAEYMAAVEANDVKTLRELVSKAAKEAGYNSPSLYHGTTSFGFTTFSRGRSADSISVFVTEDEDTALTYADEDGLTLQIIFSAKTEAL